MTEHDKKYWKRVYLYFGNDLEAWYHDTETQFHEEYHDSISYITEFPEYFGRRESVGGCGWGFTDKFLEEVMTW